MWKEWKVLVIHEELLPNFTWLFPLSSKEHFNVFELIVLVLCPITLLYWFSLTAFISVISTGGRQLLLVK